MIVLLRARLIYLAIFLACAGLMGFGLYLQHVENLEPCPLCILQRYAFIATGLVALIAAIHGPGRLGRWLYSVLIVAAAGSGNPDSNRGGSPERIDEIAYRQYGDPRYWRVIAALNNVDDPLRIPEGQILSVPTLSALEGQR